MLTLDRYIDQAIYNGALTPRQCNILGMSKKGCPWRGTSVCHKCPYQPVALCDYRCQGVGRWGPDCEHRGYCKCGHDQTHRLEAWGLV